LSSRQIAKAAEEKKDDIVNLLKRLIATPSLTGQEGDVARLLKQEMITEGFDATIDQVGNVVGIIKGKGDGRTLLYNGHMDHVPPGNMLTPYSAEIRDGDVYDVRGRVVYGRGASDMKGALAAMIMAGSILKELDLTLKGTLIVTGTVFEEELGNIGPPSLIDVDGFRPDAAVVGECTNLDLALGNRGVARTRVTTFGKSSHASVPERGINALYKMTKVLDRIQETNRMLPSHPVLGKASWVVCKMEVTPNVVNIVPERCEAVVDTRIIPNFTPEMVMDEQRKLVEALEQQDHEFKAKVDFLERDAETWTGYKFKLRPVVPSFYIQPDNWFAQAATKSISSVLGKQAKQKIWGFTTESYCFAERGIPTIGFGPGEERFTHSEKEVVSVEDLIMATKGYAMLAAVICGLES